MGLRQWQLVGSAPLTVSLPPPLCAQELEPRLAFESERRLECTSRDCFLSENAGCLVIAMQDLFQWLLETRSFESYVVRIPPSEEFCSADDPD